jgi:chemosensory pili system protein ChpA (sensor histidine kinase/response regulator)
MTDISSQTLHIVAKELTTTLNEARAALEAYAERSDQGAFLEKCADQLHLAHGVLRLVEVYGAALLAEEMEHVTRYILVAGSDQKRQIEGLDALMRAMVQLPTYLERVLSGGRDLALVLLPLLNDLRSVRGSPLLSEGTLLLLNLKSDQPAQPHAQQGDGTITVVQWARRLRPRFQIGLLGYIRGERTGRNHSAGVPIVVGRRGTGGGRAGERHRGKRHVEAIVGASRPADQGALRNRRGALLRKSAHRSAQ